MKDKNRYSRTKDIDKLVENHNKKRYTILYNTDQYTSKKDQQLLIARSAIPIKINGNSLDDLCLKRHT